MSLRMYVLHVAHTTVEDPKPLGKHEFQTYLASTGSIGKRAGTQVLHAVSCSLLVLRCLGLPKEDKAVAANKNHYNKKGPHAKALADNEAYSDYVYLVCVKA